MISPALAVGIFAALLVGAILHEASHAVVAELVGASVTNIDLWGCTVHFEIPANEPVWKDRVIGAAPLLSAALLVSVWVVLPIGVESVWTLFFACTLAMNTVFVSLRDWKLMVKPEHTAS